MILEIKNFIFRVIKKIYLKLYIKKFSNYKEAEKFCSSVSSGSYDNQVLNKFKFQKFIFSKNKLPFVYNNSHKLLLESILVYLNKYKKIPSILDIGGQFGENKLYLDHLLNCNIRYDVVEIKSIFNYQKKLKHSKFFLSIDDAISSFNYDLLFSSGAIQYFENPYKFLKKIFNNNFKFICLTRINLSTKPGIFSAPSYIELHGASEGHILYKNNFKKKIVCVPNTQLSEKKIKNIAKYSNYEIIREAFGLTGNFGPNSYSKDFIFKKIN